MSAIDQGVVVVTGASAGIGEALARQLAPRVKTLVLVARRRDRLQTLAAQLTAEHRNLDVHICECDLVDGASRQRLISDVEGRHGSVDVLINNAGVGDMSLFELTEWKKLDRMIALNVTALTHLTHHFVRGMVSRKKGGIVNISSGFGLVAMPGFSAYCASKHYVAALTEGLAMELRGTGVTVTQVCPGPVATEFIQHIGDNFMEQDAPSIIQISAEQCARGAIAAFDRSSVLTIPGFVAAFLTYWGAALPRWVRRVVFALTVPMLRRKQLAMQASKSAS
jgi:short-subunit dehydrogenase